MAWIEVHQSLVTHRKTYAAADALDIKPVYLVGHLVSLWLWCLDNAPSGDLGGISPRIIARSAQWDDDPQAFLDALLEAGFLSPDDQGTLTIHDWWDYAGKLIERRTSDRERKRANRKSHGVSAGCPQDVQWKSARTVPNPTLPNPTQQNVDADAQNLQADNQQPEPEPEPPPQPESPPPVEMASAKPKRSRPKTSRPIVKESGPDDKAEDPKPDDTVAKAAFGEAFKIINRLRGFAPKTRDEYGRQAAAIKQILLAGGTPEQLEQAWKAAAQRWEPQMVNPNSVASHFGELLTPLPRGSPKNGRAVDRSETAGSDRDERLAWIYANNPGLKEAEENARATR